MWLFRKNKEIENEENKYIIKVNDEEKEAFIDNIDNTIRLNESRIYDLKGHQKTLKERIDNIMFWELNPKQTDLERTEKELKELEKQNKLLKELKKQIENK